MFIVHDLVNVLSVHYMVLIQEANIVNSNTIQLMVSVSEYYILPIYFLLLILKIKIVKFKAAIDLNELQGYLLE